VRYIVENISTKATILLQISFQSKVCTQSYGPPKSRKSQLWEFRDSQMGVLGQNAIWMLVPWPGTKYTIRGKVVASPKFEPWWVLWVRVYPWFVLASKVFQLYTNQLVVWFVQVHVSDWLLIIGPNPILELQHAFLPPKVLWATERAPTLSPSIVFTFGLVVESIKELGGASNIIKNLCKKNVTTTVSNNLNLDTFVKKSKAQRKVHKNTYNKHHN
jgi:hypothetical protein